MSELKSVALWHPDEKIFASWHDWFSSRGWMVIDVGESVSEVPEVGVWLVAWNEQFHRPQVRVEFEVRRQKFPQEVWCASVLRHHMDTVSLDELSLFGLDEVFCEEPLDEDLVEERLEFALRFALLPASRHRVRNATHLGSKGNLAETVSALTGQLMRETSLRAITFWLKSPGQGVRGWLRRTEDRIESLAGGVRMDNWEEHPGDRWGLPRRSKAHRWQLQTKDEMAWWVPLAHRRRIIGYLELVFPSSVSADIEVGVLRVREWVPALVRVLQEHSESTSGQKADGGLPPGKQSAQILVDSARRAHRPLTVLLIGAKASSTQWLSKLSLRECDVVYELAPRQTLLVLPETTGLSALTLLTRLSETLTTLEQVGMASLHDDGVSLEDLIDRARNYPLWSGEQDGTENWAVFEQQSRHVTALHLARVWRSTHHYQEGRALFVTPKLDTEALCSLPDTWSGIVVSPELLGEIPPGWSWVPSKSVPASVEAFLLSSDGTYGVRGPGPSVTTEEAWEHSADSREVLTRWSQLTNEYLLGED